MDSLLKPPIAWPADMVRGLPNCGIVAMAICARIPLTQATEWFRHRQQSNRNWKGSTHAIYYDEFLRTHGVWFEHVKYDRNRTRTIGDFAEWGTKPGVIYAIRCAGHMMVCCDGWIGDQHHIVPVDRHWKRNARLKDHWEVYG